MNEQIHIFDRVLVRRRRDRAANNFAAQHGVLHHETATCLLDRIADVKRDFTTILDLGAHDSALAKALVGDGRLVVATDLSEAMLKSSNHNQTGAVPLPSLREGLGEGWQEQYSDKPSPNPSRKDGREALVAPPLLHPVTADEEWLPFQDASFDLITSNLTLHWVNDLPGALAQIRTALKPDGLFLATILGGQTLIELRTCLLDAELAITGGASPRMSPNLDRPTASALLQRAGFNLPVTDHETFTLTYSNIFALMRDLRGMGESNAHQQRLRHPTRRDIFAQAGRLYQQRYALPDGRIPATFEVIFLHGWS